MGKLSHFKRKNNTDPIATQISKKGCVTTPITTQSHLARGTVNQPKSDLTPLKGGVTNNFSKKASLPNKHKLQTVLVNSRELKSTLLTSKNNYKSPLKHNTLIENKTKIPEVSTGESRLAIRKSFTTNNKTKLPLIMGLAVGLGVALDYKENHQNAESIYNFLESKFGTNSNLNILDICCGAFTKGISYDRTGQVYEPLVAQHLAQKGYSVTGLDLRKNQQKVDYNHITNIDILERDWTVKLPQSFDSIIFLRSWDTPEILLHFQNQTGVTDPNNLTLKIAEYFLPQFGRILKHGGIFFTTDIISPDLSIGMEDFENAKANLAKLFLTNGFKIIDCENGLIIYQKQA